MLLFRTSIAVATIVFLAACSTPYKRPIVVPDDEAFSGIAASLSTHSDVEVISIHGMCTHSLDSWARPATAELANAFDAEAGEPELVRSFDGLELYRAVVDAADGRITHYSVVWSPITTPAKEALCYDVGKLPDGYEGACDTAEYPYKRASLNGMIKVTLLNDCLADVPIYLGEDGKRIRRAVRQALGHIESQRSSNGVAPLFLITESLGSKILLDSLTVKDDVLTMAELGDLGDVLAPTEVIFMAANQGALLDLAKGSTKGVPSETLRDLIQLLGDKRKSSVGIAMGLEADKEILVVAFSDPNDLLSYTIPENALPSFFNVIISNSRTVFGAFEDPWAAHTDYLSNEEVWKLIVDGYRPD